MADYYSGSISIPVNYLKAYEEDLYPAFKETFVSALQEMKAGKKTIIEMADLVSDGVATFSSDYAYYGTFPNIENALKVRGIPFNRDSGAYDQDSEEHYTYRPDEGEFIYYGSEPSFPCAELRKFLAECKDSPEKAIAQIQKDLDTVYDVKVKPLTDYASSEIKKKKSSKKVATFEIYQMKGGDEYHGVRFSSTEDLKRFCSLDVDDINISMYDHMYKDEYKDGMILDDIYSRFNIHRPDDFKGHSLSVSDVIVINPVRGKSKAYYVDSVGFTELKNFFPKTKEKTQSVR